jgi:hypothetical protein
MLPIPLCTFPTWFGNVFQFICLKACLGFTFDAFVLYSPYFGHDLKSNVTIIFEMIENNVEGISFCLNNLKPMAPIVFIIRSYGTHLRFCKFHYCWMESLLLIFLKHYDFFII